ncbi:MAG: hypothetical protein ACM30I_16840 [Gemmatimonas sp.]
MSSGANARARVTFRYRVKAAMLRREARRPCNLRVRTLLLYSASEYDWLAGDPDDCSETAAIELDLAEPTLH